MKDHLSTAITLCIVFLFLSSHPFAIGSEVYPADRSGLMATPAGHDNYTRLQPVSSSIDARVTGMSTRVQVRQSFRNESSAWMEAVYVFPLPENASIDSLEMTIGERTVQGVLQPRDKARKTYQTARNNGQRTSLLEQQRANLFSTRVANIPPGENVDIAIAYQSAPRYSDGVFSQRIPLTLTPRYVPGQRLQPRNGITTAAIDAQGSYKVATNGWAEPTDLVADADEITPPMTASATMNMTEIVITIDSGIELERVESRSHSIVSTAEDNLWQVSLTDQRVPMDRDFEINWYPKHGSSPHAAVFRQDRTDADSSESFASIMLIPPQEFFNEVSTGREVIFVIDTSGSMQGNSIIQARQALQLGINRLSVADTFNVIEFNDSPRTLFHSAQAANQENRHYANQWVQNLYAEGGTEIATALRTALLDNTRSSSGESGSIRQIVFVTDGSVGNEDAIFRQLQQKMGQNRLFTIGIGSAPNTWFMRKAAEIGRGSYTYIARDTEVQEKMLALFHKLERPVLTNLSLNWEGVAKPEIYPATPPDLYAGEPVLADARWPHAIGSADLVISGNHGGRQWSRRLQVKASQTHTDSPQPNNDNRSTDGDQGLYKLWARRKIDDLENRLLLGADQNNTERQVTETALNYGLVTRYTSLVAVENEVVRDPAIEPLAKTAVPSIIPAGNTMHFPQGGLGIGLRLALTLIFSVLAIVFSLATLQQVQELG
ncbi:marine proteobacterial sortase target protein [Chromatiales bacterium (ex Bugula neritina AB1)]|nr:marine proteobacterial sortase target protein [Chromatiales bacterium (ex Bugula neritina AB1)]